MDVFTGTSHIFTLRDWVFLLLLCDNKDSSTPSSEGGGGRRALLSLVFRRESQVY
jgi:hypothetical protein